MAKGHLLAVKAFEHHEDEAMAQFRKDWARVNVNVRTYNRAIKVDRAYLALKVIVVRVAE